MDSFEYEKFSPANLEAFRKGRNLAVRAVPRKTQIVVGVMYGILLLLVLIMLLVTEAKFSQLSGQMKEMKHLLDSHKSPQSSEALSLKGAEKTEPSSEKWIKNKGSSYLLATFRTTWHNSETFCLREGGHLLTINTEEEQKYINSVRLRDNYWIGLIERENEGEWTWADGTDFSSTPHFWAMNQPDEWRLAADGEDCGEINPQGLWNDAQCNLHHRFICEKEEV